MLKEIRVCIAGRNHAAYTEECLRSVVSQRDVRAFVDWTDDASDTLDALSIAQRILTMQGHPSHVELREERRGGLANLWHAILRAPDDAVCVMLGGDDMLEQGALDMLYKIYQDPSVWLTYGTYRNDDGSPILGGKWDGTDPRSAAHLGGNHDFLWMPFTFRAWLAKKILPEDLKIAGYWQWSSGDVALNVPMVEMAGPAHAKWISSTWYVRRIHNQNDSAVDRRLQDYCNWISYGRPKYGRISGPDDKPKRTPHTVDYGLLFSPHDLCAHGVAI